MPQQDVLAFPGVVHAGQPPSPPDHDKKTRPTKALPTPRIKFAKQLDILRAFGSIGGSTARPVKNAEVASFVDMNADVLSMCNPFFSEIGLLHKRDGGHQPAPEVTSFSKAHEWKQLDAPHRLVPIFEQSWVWEILSPRLSFGNLLEDDAIAVLGEAINAGPPYRRQLKLLLEYLQTVGLIRCEGGEIRKNQVPEQPAVDSMEEAPMTPPREEPPPAKESISHTVQPRPNGRVQIQFSIDIDVAELAGWEADRLAAFFAGIAQVLAAKGRN